MSPAPRYYLAFDLGASSSRAVLGTLHAGVMQMEVLHRFATPIIEQGDHLFWDLDLMWEELQVGLHLALEAAPDLRSLSVDSWAVDHVPLDESGAPLRNPYCYRDPRTTGVMARAFDTLSRGEIYAQTGIQFLPFNTLYQVLAEQEESAPDNPAIRLTIADYFNYCFSGQRSIERSMASTTQMMDIHTGRWSSQIMNKFALDRAQWPDIIPSGSSLGPVLHAPRVTTVATCSHDTGCAVGAVPVESEEKNWAFISSGTWSLLGMERDSPLITDATRETGFTNEAGIDGTIRFLKNLSGLWALQECVREWGSVVWVDLETEARASDATGIIVDLEDPRFLARGGMEKRIKGYCHDHGLRAPDSRGDIVRIILSSVAASYRRTLNELQDVTDMTFQKIYLIGGGSNNALLCQLTAEACGITVVAGPVEATALGNLLIQARALGDLPEGQGIRDIARRSSRLKVYHPQQQSI